MWIYAAAGYNVALAAFHLGFWRMFRWKDELPKLHPANQGVMQVLNVMLTVFFLLLAGLQVLRADEMVTSPLGRTLMAGIMGFWLIRAALQPVFFRALPSATNDRGMATTVPNYAAKQHRIRLNTSRIRVVSSTGRSAMTARGYCNGVCRMPITVRMPSR